MAHSITWFQFSFFLILHLLILWRTDGRIFTVFTIWRTLFPQLLDGDWWSAIYTIEVFPQWNATFISSHVTDLLIINTITCQMHLIFDSWQLLFQLVLFQYPFRVWCCHEIFNISRQHLILATANISMKWENICFNDWYVDYVVIKIRYGIGVHVLPCQMQHKESVWHKQMCVAPMLNVSFLFWAWPVGFLDKLSLLLIVAADSPMCSVK